MKLAAAGFVADDVGAHDIGGHEGGRELDARKAARQGLAERTDEDGLAQPGDAFEQDMPARDQRDHGIAQEVFLTDDQSGELGFERLRQLGHLGCVDARFFGDHDPPWRITLFRTGPSLLTELREVLADEVALTAWNETLVGGIQCRLLVGLDHLAVGAERHVLTGSKRRGIVLRLTRDRLARHVYALGALRACAAPGARPARARPPIATVATPRSG